MSKKELNDWIETFICEFDIFWIEDGGHSVIIQIPFEMDENNDESGTFIRFQSWDEQNTNHEWLKDDYFKLKKKLNG